MPVTSVFTDQSEYSRYYPGLQVITATIQVSNPTPGNTLQVALFRLDGYGAVTTKTIPLTSATQYQVFFDLNKDCFDSMGIYRAKAGDYVIQVTDEQGNVTQSEMFAVSLVTVKEITTEWAKGVTFYDYEILRPRVQPQVITGVEVTEVCANHYKGPFPLSFTAGNPATLSWNGGAPVPIVGEEPQSLLLLDQRKQDYIMVQVNPLLLPSQSVTETLVIDNGRISERAMILQVRRAADWVQQQIITKIEPNVVDTDPTGYVDEVAIPETYYQPRTFNKWMSFKIPYPNVLDVSVTGYFNQGKVATVPREWTVWNERTGIVELVPSNASQVIWSFYNGVFVLSYLYNYSSIPGFWHYRATVGLRDLWNERAVVREAIAKKAVWELLNSAGSAYRAGYASQSASRDGISESASYTSSAMYGTYGGHFSGYRDWLEDNIPRMKKRFCGIQYVTI